jgi:signal transduction histidine kinase
MNVEARASELEREGHDKIARRTDRLFGWLMLAQWLFAILLAVTITPYAWAGSKSSLHLHLYAAVILGGLISSLPWLLIRLRPGSFGTRVAVACAQMLWSALLIHLTGGRIETHFHVFGSLAILAFYRDVRILVPATVVVAADHFIRGLYWPESVYGVVNPDWWRFLEHAGWVVFIDVFLVMHCIQGVEDMRDMSRRQAEVEALSEIERAKSRALDAALEHLKQSQEALVRSERPAAVGQLAASVGHELRNPLAAVRNAHSYITKKIETGGNGAPSAVAKDPRVRQFSDIINRELDACGKIISDLLDFARGRPVSRRPCPLRPLVEESLSIVPKRPGILVKNEIPADLPVPNIDKDQFRQVFTNLIQNAIEAFPSDGKGEVIVSAVAQAGGDWVIRVKDNGPGMSEEVKNSVFQPLYSTKPKGTGLGLAIVQGSLTRHGAVINVHSTEGLGTEFVIELPVYEHPREVEGHAHPVG